MGRKSPAPSASPTPRRRVIARPVRGAIGARGSLQPVVEHAIALGYGLTYDAIVRGFQPYEALIDEVVALVTRGVQPGAPATTRVIDISCGIGTVAARLARRGWTVVALDAVAHLVAVARRHYGGRDLALSFHHADLARDPLPAAEGFDVLVSMHTLYWHPEPAALLAACRRVLKPGGHAVFLTYEQPARVVPIFAALRRQHGWTDACRALRWLIPTALFDLFRGVEPRYLTRAEFDAALGAAGFEILERRATFLAGMSLLSWARQAPVEPSSSP